jgi:alpha-beta hydrolase superfamily lysophospholipase
MPRIAPPSTTIALVGSITRGVLSIIIAAVAAIPLHFGTTAAGGARFGWYHTAVGGTPRAGVVVCNPIGDDDVRAHRTLRHLADALAGAGFAVLRFDFWGTGDSRGDERAPDLVARWRDDIGLAVAELRARSGATAIAVVGLRLGATLATLAAATRDDIASLVAWGPYETGDAFVADATRTDQMRRALEPQSFLCEPDGWQPGGEQASGFLLTPQTIAALRDIDLGRLPRMTAQTLVVGTGNVSGDDRLRARLTALGVAPTYRHLPGFRFLTTAPQKSEVPRPIVDAIVGWLSARHPAVAAGDARAVAATAPAVAVGDELTEQPLVIGTDRPRFGIVTRAAERLRGTAAQVTGRPAIVMLSSGCTHRVGPHRLYVTLARRWAQLGFDVLRMDLSGIGDSPAAPGCAENLSYPRDGVADVQAAIDALPGNRNVVLFGHNSGADFAFLTALRDTRVVGAILVNPRTFGVYDFDTVTSYQRARYYQGSLLRAASWKKALSGRVDFGRAIATITPKLVDVVKHRAAALLGRRGNNDHQADVPDGIRTLTERGVDTLLLATENDPGIDFVDSRFGSTMTDLGRLGGYTREDIRGTDHTFTSRFAQDMVSQRVTDHLSTRYLARVG